MGLHEQEEVEVPPFPGSRRDLVSRQLGAGVAERHSFRSLPGPATHVRVLTCAPTAKVEPGIDHGFVGTFWIGGFAGAPRGGFTNDS